MKRATRSWVRLMLRYCMQGAGHCHCDTANPLVSRCCKRHLELAVKVQRQQIDSRNLQLDHSAGWQVGKTGDFGHEWNVRDFYVILPNDFCGGDANRLLDQPTQA